MGFKRHIVTAGWLVVLAGGGVATVNLVAEAIFAPALGSVSMSAHLAVVSVYVCLALALALVVALCAGLAALLRFTTRLGLASRASLLLGLLAAAPLYFLGRELVDGAWAAQQSWAGVIPALTAVIGSLGLAVALRLAASTRWWRALTAVILLAMVGVVCVDVVAFPGLYQEAHLALKVVAVACALAVVARIAWIGGHPREDRLSGAKGWLFGVVGLALCVAAPVVWGTLDVATRTELVLRGGAATDVVQLLHRAPTVTHLSYELQRLDGQHTPLPPLRQPVIAEEPPIDNVLMLFVDTLRADALPPARGATNDYSTAADTPFLNDFLKTCFRFERAYAQSSATHRSMPATFRSLHTWEPPAASGEALGNVMASHGLHTTAVINNYFFEPRYRDAQQLVDGFNELKIFDSFAQAAAKKMIDETFASLGEQRFFMWTHYFAVHQPGYDGKKLSTRIPHKERYRRSLKWLDSTLKYVVERLRHHGHADDTVIVLASDHGEGLGANNQNTHGPTVFEEEIRVPLAFCLPQSEAFAEPRVVTETVSNIDIVPTLHELLGLPPSPAHRGQSLAPTLRDGAAVVERPVYFENGNGRRIGVAHGVDKLIYHPKDEVFMRFDVAADPTEENNLIGRDEARDDELRRQLFFVNPELVQNEVEANSSLIETRLARVDPQDPGVETEFLLALGAYAKEGDIDERAARIFRRSDDPRVKFWVLRYFRDRPIAGELIKEAVESLEASQEAEVIALAADAGVTRFDEKWVRRRLEKFPADDALWRSWLQLVARWPRKSGDWGPALSKALQHAADTPDAFSVGTLHHMLDNVGSVRWSKAPPKLTARVRAHLTDERPLIRGAAINALGALGDEQSYDAIRDLALNKGLGRRIHQPAIRALAKIDPERAPADIVEVALRDIFLLYDAVQVLEPLKDAEGVKALGKKHRRYRGNTDRVVARIEKAGR